MFLTAIVNNQCYSRITLSYVTNCIITSYFGCWATVLLTGSLKGLGRGMDLQQIAKCTTEPFMSIAISHSKDQKASFAKERKKNLVSVTTANETPIASRNYDSRDLVNAIQMIQYSETVFSYNDSLNSKRSVIRWQMYICIILKVYLYGVNVWFAWFF